MSKYFAKPTVEQYTDSMGYVDGYEFDMAMDQWQWQFPDLKERWCPHPFTQVLVDNSRTDLYNLLTA
jgi:hypothetical protein|tara:strand:+ start:874 stop:1074 length:201 start_codon:yes stop_codon:yes gene_type:complete